MGLSDDFIKEKLNEMLKKGVGRRYYNLLDEFKGLKAEDIAAAAIMLYSEREGISDVRVRSLKKTEFVPLKSKEMTHSIKRKVAEQPSHPGSEKPKHHPKAQNAGQKGKSFTPKAGQHHKKTSNDRGGKMNVAAKPKPNYVHNKNAQKRA